MRPDLTEEEFERIVQETIQALPEEFRGELDKRNIVIAIKDYPDAADPPDFVRGNVLGFYQGVPLRRRGADGFALWPDRIVIYKKLVERYAANETDVRELLRRVVLHEIGHFFGLSDRELRKLGY